MTCVSTRCYVFPLCLAGCLLIGGCGEDQGPGVMEPPPGRGGPGAGGRSSPEIKQIMVKLAKGPQSLTGVIENELKQDPPPWETIQGQTKDYAQSAEAMGRFDPPKGAKESWTKLTAAFAESASAMNRAAAAKDKDAALAAHQEIKVSCNACHREHRPMGGRGGGPGGPPPGGPGGPPPGGPGGPPPAEPKS